VIILAFIVGCMCSGMMKQMCGGRLVEGSLTNGLPICNFVYDPILILDNNLFYLYFIRI